MQIRNALAIGSLIALSACSYAGLGGKSSGGDDYTVNEKSVAQDQIEPQISAAYDESTHSVYVKALFEVKNSSVRHTLQQQTIRLQSQVTVDSAPMKFQTDESYVGDDSKSSVIGCYYSLQLNDASPSHVYEVKWTAADGKTYVNHIAIPSPVTLENVPAHVQAGFNIQYDGPVVAENESVLVGIQDSGLFPALVFAKGSKTLFIPSSPYLAPQSELKLTPAHRSGNQAESLPSGGGNVEGEYDSPTISVHVD